MSAAAATTTPDAFTIVARQSELPPVAAAEYLLDLAETDCWPGLRDELTVALTGIIARSRLGYGGILRSGAPT